MWGKWLKRIPWGDLLLLLVVTVLLGWVWVKGYDSGHLDAQRDGDKALAQLQSKFDAYRLRSAEQQNEALRIVVARYNAQVAAAHQADADFQAQKDKLEKQNAELRQRVNDVTRRWVDAKGRSHPVKCVFTAGFLQQYNAAIGTGPGDGGVSAAARSGSAGKKAGATDTTLARLRDSGVSQADVLANVIDNARQC
ncbi:hypothetical protein ACQSED_26970, partial [Salmonella enterica]|uniref:hypothetical protein n=1 Tax=Salmonella enterica TaxID=28901 RepID=UPI003D321939